MAILAPPINNSRGTRLFSSCDAFVFQVPPVHSPHCPAMVQTRKRGRNSRTPATTTTTSNSVSPLGNTNSLEPETPDTSEPELDLLKKPVAPAIVVTRSARKRTAEDEVDIDVAPKRRVITNAVVVKVPRMRASKTKARDARPCLHCRD